jgi:ribosomal protein S18 acetylase RimI-like enzyme
MTVGIRPMAAGDKPALMQILRNTPEFKPQEVAVAEEVIDAYLNDPQESGYFTLVAVDNSEISGYICYGETPCTVGTWDIYWVAVDRKKRGRGIGNVLSETAEAAIKKGGGRLAIIETSSTPLYDNTRNFYLGRGYETIARIPDFYMTGDDKLILVKKL